MCAQCVLKRDTNELSSISSSILQEGKKSEWIARAHDMTQSNSKMIGTWKEEKEEACIHNDNRAYEHNSSALFCFANRV